jgi:hypothetical protein
MAAFDLDEGNWVATPESKSFLGVAIQRPRSVIGVLSLMPRNQLG